MTEVIFLVKPETGQRCPRQRSHSARAQASVPRLYFAAQSSQTNSIQTLAPCMCQDPAPLAGFSAFSLARKLGNERKRGTITSLKG